MCRFEAGSLQDLGFGLTSPDAPPRLRWTTCSMSAPRTARPSPRAGRAPIPDKLLGPLPPFLLSCPGRRLVDGYVKAGLDITSTSSSVRVPPATIRCRPARVWLRTGWARRGRL